MQHKDELSGSANTVCCPLWLGFLGKLVL